MTVYVNRNENKFYSVNNAFNAGNDLIRNLQNNFDINFYLDDFVPHEDYDVREDFINQLNNLSPKLRLALAKALCTNWHVKFLPDSDEVEDDFNSISGFRDIEFVLEYLKAHNTPHFNYWRVSGFAQGEIGYAYTFTDFDENSFMHNIPVSCAYKFYDFADYLSSCLYGTFIDINECDAHGDLLDSGDYDLVSDLYLGVGDHPNYHDRDIDQYMKKTYNALPADTIRRYNKLVYLIENANINLKKKNSIKKGN